MSYEYRFFIRTTKNDRDEIIEKIIASLDHIKNYYTEFAPRYYTCFSKRNAEEYINTPDEFKRHFKNDVVSLFSSLDEEHSCSYIFDDAVDISGLFHVSLRLPIEFDMTSHNISVIDTLLKDLICILEPEYAYVRTNEEKYIGTSLRKQRPIYDFVHWRLYCNDRISSIVFDKAISQGVGRIELLNDGRLFILSDADIDNMSPKELNFYIDENK